VPTLVDINEIDKEICSQEGESGGHLSTCQTMAN